MSDSSTCPSCGTELPTGSLEGSICPACLLERGLFDTDFLDEEESNDGMTDRARDIFSRAFELPVEEREACLSQECGENAKLRQKVEQMLSDASRADSFFGDGEEDATLAADGSGKTSGKKTPATGSGSRGNLSSTASLTEKEGDIIGSYKLLQQIGEGGFGTVWMAEQNEPISRRVALKVIKAGMDTREVLTRFEAERQALAMMDHSNIAKVLDAGATGSGRPFFAMELVKGIPITRFCDQQKLDTRQRLALFGEVCSAISHAHQKGIIHRDIKPSNVLVALEGDKPVVKVIDFGIAKATQGNLTDKTLFTLQEQFMGTPAYMSPEQAGMSGLDIDTRSDIYSLGVLLYELLSGRPPFDPGALVSGGYEEMRRIIREEEPQVPSLRLSAMANEKNADTTQTHGSAPEKLSRRVRGDLDWIVMKSIEKDRTRRYESVGAFATDIRRHLSNVPVEAAAPSASYRFQKFARRKQRTLASCGSLYSTALLTEFDPDNATAHSNLGTVQLQFGKINEAIDSFSRAVELDPDNVAAHLNLGVAFEQVDQTDKAINCFRCALELEPDNAHAHSNLGFAMQKEGNMDVANESYRKAIELDPGNAVALIHLARAYADRGKIEKCGFWVARLGLAMGIVEEDSLARQIRFLFRKLKIELPAETGDAKIAGWIEDARNELKDEFMGRE